MTFTLCVSSPVKWRFLGFENGRTALYSQSPTNTDLQVVNFHKWQGVCPVTQVCVSGVHRDVCVTSVSGSALVYLTVHYRVGRSSRLSLFQAQDVCKSSCGVVGTALLLKELRIRSGFPAVQW